MINESLPFQELTLVTQDTATAQAAATAHSEITTALGRNWEVGNAEWDMCTAPVLTTWFMAVSTHYSAATTFALATSDDGYKPLVPFKHRDSLYCDCVCKDRVDAAAAITPGYEYDIAAEYSVLHTATRDAYCASLTPQATPSINGYFAHVLGNETLADMYNFYDRERYGVIETLEPPTGVESQCGAAAPEAASCVFPFKYRNVTYNSCTLDGTSGAYGTSSETDDGWRAFRASGTSLPWCATSVGEDGEAEDWMYCRSDIVGYVPGNEGVRVRRRRQSEGDSVTCTQTGGSFTCSPTLSPTASPTAAPSTSPTRVPTVQPSASPTATPSVNPTVSSTTTTATTVTSTTSTATYMNSLAVLTAPAVPPASDTFHITLEFSTPLLVGTAKIRGYFRATSVSSGGTVNFNNDIADLTTRSGTVTLQFSTVGIDWGTIQDPRVFMYIFPVGAGSTRLAQVLHTLTIPTTLSPTAPTTAPSATPTAPPSVSPTISPTEAPTAGPTAAPTTIPSMLLVRPFFSGDVDIMVDSFSTWDGNGMPCAVESGPGGLFATHGPVDLVLYYARDVTNETNLETLVDTLDT